ncbi:MAG: IS110 family transposase [Anaerolineales bacterium]
MNASPETIPLQRYIGIDSHKHYVMVGGMNARREWNLRPRKVQMPRFRAWAAQNLKASDTVVLETTANVWDIYDIVAPLVSKTMVANAYKVRQIAEARVKTDKEDVKRLLTLLIANIVPEVWVPPMHVRELRSLISFRWRIGKQLTMSKNRLHSVVQRFNLKPPEGNLLAEKNQDWWAEQEFSELTGFQVELDLEIIAHLEGQKAKIDQKLAELSNIQPWSDEMVYLMQIPGFGLLTGMILLSAVGDSSRFSHPKKLVGYAGLGAGVHSSGQKHQEKSITKQGRKELRWVVGQAAWAAVRSDPYWKAQYQRLTKAKHPNKAIVAIARRLLVSAWHILTKHEPYRRADDETIAYKMMIWSQRMDEKALRGLTRQQFIKYGLLRLGVGQDLTRIERRGVPRRIAPTNEVLALRPELKPPD